MQHDTSTTTDTMVSAEEAAILGRFADRASKSADLPDENDGSYIMLVMI